MDPNEGSRQDARPADTDKRREYRGHEVVFPADERRKRIFIDGRPVKYGLAGGEYYLHAYAYDRADSLEEVVRRYIDYLEGAEKRGKEK